MFLTRSDLNLTNKFSYRFGNLWYNLIGQAAQNVTFELAFWFFAFSFAFSRAMVTSSSHATETWKMLVTRKSGKITTERFIGFDLRAKMAGMITVSFEGKQVGLSKEDLNISELERIYQLDSPGAHLKIKSGAGFQNIWPPYLFSSNTRFHSLSADRNA